MSTELSRRPFDMEAGWEMSSEVSVRPERFGALLYHFGTRRLSFLKSPLMLQIVRGLADSGTAREACIKVGVPETALPTYRAALMTLAASDMIRERNAT